MIKVLVADDSAFMRRVITDLFATQPDFKVLDTAKTGKEAIEKVIKLKPDLLTLDINMPIMDGLSALEVIMKDCPLPVVMVSSITRKGADATIKAMGLGAIDFICKPNGSLSKLDSVADEILAKCRAAAQVKIRKRLNGSLAVFPPPVKKPLSTEKVAMPERKTFTATRTTTTLTRGNIRQTIKAAGHSSAGRFIVLGCSTGGPNALQEFVPRLPANLPCPVLIVQHMPPGFTASLARRLDEISSISVKEAEDHEPLKPGTVYIAPGNYHMTVAEGSGGREISLNQNAPLGTLRPAADMLFESVAKYGNEVVSVILTGMGQDGANGMEKIKKAGGYVIAESEETCVVYGMPKAVVDRGLADEVLPVQNIADAAVKALKR